MEKFICIFLIICAKIIEINSAGEGNDAGSSQQDNKGKRPWDAYTAGQMPPNLNEFVAQPISLSNESSDKRNEAHLSPNERAEPGNSDSLPVALGQDNEVEIVGQQQHSTLLQPNKSINKVVESPRNLGKAREEPSFVAGTMPALGGTIKGRTYANFKRPKRMPASDKRSSTSQQQTSPQNVEEGPDVWQTADDLLLKVAPEHFEKVIQKFTSKAAKTDPFVQNLIDKHLGSENTPPAPPRKYKLSSKKRNDENQSKMPSGSSSPLGIPSEDIREKLPRTFNLSFNSGPKHGSQEGGERQTSQQKHYFDQNPSELDENEPKKTSHDPGLIRTLNEMLSDAHKQAEQSGIGGIESPPSNQMPGNEGPGTSHPTGHGGLKLSGSSIPGQLSRIGEPGSSIPGQLSGIGGTKSSHPVNPDRFDESSQEVHHYHSVNPLSHLEQFLHDDSNQPHQILHQHQSEAQSSQQQQQQSIYQQNPIEFHGDPQQQTFVHNPNLNRSLAQFLRQRKFKQNSGQPSDIGKSSHQGGESSHQGGESSQGIHQHHSMDPLHHPEQFMQAETSNQPHQVEHEQFLRTYHEDLNKLYEYIRTINYNLDELRNEDDKLKLEQDQIYHMLMPSQIMGDNLSTDYVQQLHERKIELRNERRALANQIDEFQDGKLQILWELYEKQQNQPKPPSGQ